MKTPILIFLFLVSILAYSQDTLKVAYHSQSPPYSFTDSEGNPAGLIIDFFELWSDKLNTPLIYQPCLGKHCTEMLLDGRVDILSATELSADTSNLAFSTRILRISSSLFLLQGRKPATIYEVKDTVAVYRAGKTYRFLKRQFPHLKLKVYDSFEAFEDAIREAKLYGFIYDVPDPVDEHFKVSPPRNYFRYEHILTHELRPAVRRENQELIEKLIHGWSQIEIHEIKAIVDGYDLYLKVDHSFETLLIVASVILVAALIFIIYLRRRNRSLAEMMETETGEHWMSLIAEGETDKVEFKSSFRWDYKQEKVNKVLQQVISKTISAFLNTNGGYLFIGIDDDGNILGLERDYKTTSKGNRDGFLLSLTNHINQTLGKNAHQFLSIKIIPVDGKEICMIEISKSDSPVFLGSKEQEEFYIRTPASSQPLSMREAMDYIQKNWP